MKKLEEILNLPETKKEISEATKEDKTSDTPEELLRNIEEFDKISSALPVVKGLGDLGDQELDTLAQKATDAYDDLMDLGMNVESRYSGRIFEVASSMLKNAIDAKSAKLDKKLRMIELQLKKAKLDQNSGDDSINVPSNEYIVTDRNSLLEKIKNMK